MTPQQAAHSTADFANGLVTATVEIAAPPERVFRALTTAADMVQWWGTEGMYKTENWTGDVRAGGKWKADLRGADGSAFSISGTYVEVDPPNKLVHTWNAPWDAGQETRVTYELAAAGDGTRLTLRHEGFAGRAAQCEAHRAGWDRVMGWISGYLA